MSEQLNFDSLILFRIKENCNNSNNTFYIIDLIKNGEEIKLRVIKGDDDAFFNRNWVRACWDRWAGWPLDAVLPLQKPETKRIGGGLPVAAPMPKSVLSCGKKRSIS